MKNELRSHSWVIFPIVENVLLPWIIDMLKIWNYVVLSETLIWTYSRQQVIYWKNKQTNKAFSYDTYFWPKICDYAAKRQNLKGWICRIVSYRIVSYHIISYCIVSYRIISYRIVSYHIISYHTNTNTYTLNSCSYLESDLVEPNLPPRPKLSWTSYTYGEMLAEPTLLVCLLLTKLAQISHTHKKHNRDMYIICVFIFGSCKPLKIHEYLLNKNIK